MLLFLLFMLVASSSHSRENYNYKHIFLLAGQSNMAGRGGVDGDKWNGKVPTQCRPNPSILRLSAAFQWEEAREPLHADIDVGKVCGVGPGMAFANAVVRAMGSRIGTVGLVPCAVGGTKLSDWAQGSGLYSEMVGRSREALKEGGAIRGVLWYQGESDTVRREDAVAYKARMEKLVLDLRSGLRLPWLPIIQVVLASGEGPYVEMVREAQRGMRVSNVTYVNAKGLELKTDRLHLTTEAQVRLGEMLARCFVTNFGGL